jgi:hypothetical protein
MNPTKWILLLVLSTSPSAWAKVRKVEVTKDQVVMVKTAIGIATIIQVPDRPNSIVVGDQAGFKVEYLDQAITIKPLHGGARSNLYIYTDYRRFNVQLVTGAEVVADYVVYLENPKEKVPKLTTTWTSLKRRTKNGSIELSLQRIGRSHDGVLIVEFVVHDSIRERMRPEWIWLTQSGSVRPIHNLFLSGLDLGPESEVKGTLQVLRSDIESDEPLHFELRRKTTSTLTIPKENLWRQQPNHP